MTRELPESCQMDTLIAKLIQHNARSKEFLIEQNNHLDETKYPHTRVALKFIIQVFR